MYNIYNCVAEFYAIEALRLLVSAKADVFLKSHERLINDLEKYSTRYTEKFALAMRDYLVLACYGEMRHAKNKAAMYIDGFTSYSKCRGDAIDDAMEYRPESIIDAAIKVFDCVWRLPEFGGEAWLKIARAARLYGSVPDTVFIDHCVDLSHNSGICFDKSEAGIFRMDNSHAYRTMLNTKATVSPDRFLRYISAVSGTLKRIFTRAVTLGLVDIGVDPTLLPTTSVPSEYEPVLWGDKTLGPVVANPYHRGGDIEDDCEDDCESAEEDEVEKEEAYADNQFEYECQCGVHRD